MSRARETGAGSVPLVISAVVGVIIAVVASFGIVVAGTAKPSSAVDKPLITYDAR